MFACRLDEDTELFLLTPSFAEEYTDLVNLNTEHLGRWFEWVGDGSTVEATREYLRDMLAKYARDEAMHLGIRYRGAAAGAITLGNIDLDLGSGEIGYWLAKGFEGKGIITSACRWLVNHAFTELSLNRIQIRVDPRNARSRAVPRRLGFTYEGTLRQVYRLHGRMEDYEIHSMLREEWPGAS